MICCVATPERVERFPCAASLSLYNDNDSFALLYIFLNILNISINLWPKIVFFFLLSLHFLFLFHSVPQRIIWQHQQQQIIKRVLKNKMSSRLNNYHTNPISKPLKEKENTSHRRHNRSWQVLKSHSINIQYIFFNDKEREKVFNE